jgi:hypothetical protein
MYWLTTAFTRIVAFLPNLIAGLVILAVGVLVGWVLARVLRPLLHRAGFDRLLGRHGLLDSTATDAGSRGVGLAAFWIVVLAAAMQAAKAFGLDTISFGLARVLAYLPHVLAAVVIFVGALMFGDWVRARMRSRAHEGAELTPSAVRSGILALGVFMALRELHIAPQIVTIAFTLVLGAIAVASAISFGLGARDTAGRLARRWYDENATERMSVKRERLRESIEEHEAEGTRALDPDRDIPDTH